MRRAIYFAVVVILLGCFAGYRYIADSGRNAFWVNESDWYVSGYSQSDPNKIPQNHQYYFRMENMSGRGIKLLGVKLSDYQGIKVSHVSISGNPIEGITVPSHSNIMVDFDVVYKNPPIHTPQMASITYRSLGVTHVQRVTIYDDSQG